MAQSSHLAAWAGFKQSIRQFFSQRGVLEVDTPLLAAHCVSDPHLDALAVPAAPGWLQTSPEFAMKRLLAAGSGDIYQICKAFRGSERGRLHSSEFTMLEWYRQGFDLQALMNETAELLAALFNSTDQPQFLRYSGLFEDRLGIDPHRATEAKLIELLQEHVEVSTHKLNRSACLDLLFAHLIQPDLQGLSFVYHYPACQAALARIEADEAGSDVALRFECFYQGVELGNAYDELRDADEYLRRHQADNVERQSLGKPQVAVDEDFVEAMRQGLPACAGIAIGLDRVFMLSQGAQSLAEVQLL